MWLAFSGLAFLGLASAADLPDGAENPGAAVDLGVGYQRAVVPVFRAAPRNRSAAQLHLSWAPAPRARVDLDWAWLRDRWPSGTTHHGPGDLRLRTAVLPFQGEFFETWLTWELKLPNASDELGLGTDEADGTVLGAAIWRGPADLRVGAIGGLAILGHPLELANQDDVPLSWLTVVRPLGLWQVRARVGGGWPTARNPARLDALMGAELPGPGTRLGLEGGAGLTAAAPLWQARAWLGWGF